MHRGQYVFAQIMAHLPLTTFGRCVARYDGEYKVKHFSFLDQFYAMAFAQLTYRESLRDIEACLAAQGRGLYHPGFRSAAARNTLADANAVRPWRIYADLAQHPIAIARPLCANEPIGLDLTETVYAFDSTTIDLCLSLFPWAPFRATCAAIKLHSLLDVRGAIPSFMHIGKGRTHDVNALDELLPEPGAFYLLDRGYMDFGRLHALHAAGAFFLIRAKRGLRAKRRYSHPVDRVGTPVVCDQTVVREVYYSKQGYPEPLRRVVVRDAAGQRIAFLTNNTRLPPQTVGELYRLRWQVELFFKWIKQHLRVRAFFGTSENAVKTQIWIAVATYVLIAIVKKRAALPHSLYELLQIFSLSLFHTTPINQLLAPPPLVPDNGPQLLLL